MAIVALLSNPRSTGNRSMLPRVREFVAAHPNIFHFEVQDVAEVPEALETIARVKPAVLVINGGDGTVQAALTELYHGGHFAGSPPPVAVLPNGKTNLIALDLGAQGDPLKTLEQILEIVDADILPHVVSRQLISLSDGRNTRPVLGMFLGGAGLAEGILFCRHKIYPLGLPNWLSHLITVAALLVGLLVGARFSPLRLSPVRVSVQREGELSGRFFLLMVTTLERLLLNMRSHGSDRSGSLKLMAIEQQRGTVFRSAINAILGRLDQSRFKGFHLKRGDEIRIEGDRPSVILDGEIFQAARGRAIVLTPTAPVPFLSLAA
jgi:Diacylglycerol kinase catalytic domain